MKPLISVIIPTYKRPPLLRRCLTALTEQTLSKEKYEIIVVDDGADAATKNEVTKFAKKTKLNLHYLPMPHRSGPAAARNKGWKHASSDIIAFTDDDTIPDKDWLTEGLKAFKKGAEVITGKVIVPLPTTPSDYQRTVRFLETAEFVTANCMSTKKALQKVSGFDERFNIAWREDSDLQFKFLEHKIPITKSERVLIVHPVRTSPWWISLKEERKNMYDALLFKKHRELFMKRIPKYPFLLTMYYIMVISAVGSLIALLLHAQFLASIFSLTWLFLTVILIIKRVYGTHITTRHIVEIVLTSVLIPFLSVFWRQRGALRYRVLFV